MTEQEQVKEIYNFNFWMEYLMIKDKVVNQGEGSHIFQQKKLNTANFVAENQKNNCNIINLCIIN